MLRSGPRAARFLAAAGHEAATRVRLFGSFARDDFTVKSDLDLLVVLGPPAPTRGWRRIGPGRYLVAVPLATMPR